MPEHGRARERERLLAAGRQEVQQEHQEQRQELEQTAEQLGGVRVVRAVTRRPPCARARPSRPLIACELRAPELGGSEAPPSGVEPDPRAPEPGPHAAAEKHVEDLSRVDFLLRVVRRPPVPPAVRRRRAPPAAPRA